MKRWTLAIAVLVTFLCSTALLFAQNAFNTRVRLDSNGSLMTAFMAYLAPTGPATSLGNTKIRLDSNGSILVTSQSGVGGSPVIVASGRTLAATNAAVASVATYTVGASDGSFIVSANLRVTTATTHAFTVECAYTDETNTTQVATFELIQSTGAAFSVSVTNANGTVPYIATPLHIRCKAGTSITIRTQAAGIYTGVVYNVEGLIEQVL